MELLLDTFVNCIEPKLSECRTKDFEMISNILLKLKFKKGLNETFVSNLWRAASVCNQPVRPSLKASALNGRSFVQFNANMANMGYHNPLALNDIFGTVNTSSELKEAKYFEDVMKSGILTLSRIATVYDERLVNNDINNKGIKMAARYDTRLYLGALATVFQLDCLVETNLPEYKGIRLNQHMRHKLSKLNSETKQSEDGIDNRVMENVLKDICVVMNIRRQGPTNFIYHGFLSPEFRTRDIAFCVDIESSKHNAINVLPLPRCYKHDLEEGVKFVKPEDYLNFPEQCIEEARTQYSIGSKSFKWFAVAAPDNMTAVT